MSRDRNASAKAPLSRTASVGDDERRTHDLLDAVAVVITDGDRRVQGWNDRATLRYGYAAETTVGRDLLSVPPFDDPEGLGAVARERLERETNRERVSVHTFVPLDHAADEVRSVEGESVIVIVHDDPPPVPQDEGFLGRQLSREWALLEAVLKQLPVGLSVTEAPDGRHLVRNTRAVRLLGSSLDATRVEARQELIGAERLDGTPYRAEELPLARALAGETIHQEDMVYRQTDGSLVHFAVNAAPIWSEDGVMRAAVATFDDVSDRRAVEAALRAKDAELERLNERLLYDALHDVLTGLPNRTLFHDRLEHILHGRAEQPDRDAALLFLDFDRFKIVNDSLGHGVGDAMLVAIARILSNAVRGGDTVARLGGDEFVILVDHVDSPERAVDLAERLGAAFEDPIRVEGHLIYTSASIGVVPSMRDYGAADDVLRDADTAMYEAKARGRGNHQVFDQGMRDEVLATMELETALRGALQRDEFRVRYAPIHHIVTRDLLGFEALVRWEHPERGLLAPDAFLAQAEEMGIVRQIDYRVWREASRTLSAWRERFGRPLLLSLNVSAQHFLSRSPEAKLLEILRETNADLGQTVVELAQGALSDVPDEVADGVLELVAQGIDVHLDDFGTGQSSLAALQRFHVTALKLDRNIVAGMADDPDCAKLAKAITALADGLDVKVLAEGVETEEQRARLEELGCTYAQGFLFSPPREEEGAVRLIGEGSDASGASEGDGVR